MASKPSETSETPKVGDNSAIEHDVIQEAARKVVLAWTKADASVASADAGAVHVMLRACAFGYFDTVDPARWHKIATQPKRTEFADTVLTDLFGIEVPTQADRQRLQRIKLVVPALLKSGGISAVQLSGKGYIMLDATTEYFKKCDPKVEATGKVELSIAKLDKGARAFLKGEMPSTKRTPAQIRAAKKADADHLPSMKLAALSKTLEDRVAKQGKQTLTGPENKALQRLLVQLLGLFATDKAGLDTEKVTAIYSKVS